MGQRGTNKDDLIWRSSWVEMASRVLIVEICYENAKLAALSETITLSKLGILP